MARRAAAACASYSRPIKELASRFGELPPALRQRVDDAEREDIERWALRILDATSLDEVFAG